MTIPSFPFDLSVASRGANDLPRAVDPFERALFDSTRADQVPAEARERVALALGLSAPAGTARPPQAASAGHQPGSASAGGAQLALARTLALVGLTGGLVALLLLARPSEVPGTAPPALLPASVSEPQLVLPAPALPPAAPLLEQSSSLPGGAAAATTATPALNPRPSRRAGHAPAHVSPSGGARGTATERQSGLLAEVARLDEARSALAAADARLALKRLQRYSSEFPNGVLAREAARLQERARALDSGSSAGASDIGEAR